MMTWKNAEDVMVESGYLMKLETASGEPSFNARSIDDAGKLSVRSDLFRVRSKS